MSYKAALDADARIAAKNAVKVVAALRQTFDAKATYERYLSTQPAKSDNPAQDRARARAWAILNVNPNMQSLNTVMQRLLAEGYVTGEAFADEQLRIARELKKADDIYVDWANWKPGDRAAALLLRPPNAFQQLLQSQGITLKEMSQTTVRDIGNAIADAVDLGMSAERSAKNIMRQVASPARALSIAITEQNRAISYATINRYKEAGLEKMEWEVSNPCDKCAPNANQVVQIGGTFNSGNTQPPAHPHCRCVLIPVLPTFEDEQMTGATLVTPPTPTPAFPTSKDIIDAALVQARAAKNDVYVPGQWAKLSSEEIKEMVITDFLAIRPNNTREEVLDWIARGKLGKATAALMQKGIVMKNGPVKIQYYSGGTTVPKQVQKEIMDHVDLLQTLNPKSTTLRVTIGQNKRNAYGWATLNGEDIWLAPKTAKTVLPNTREGGTFKMPALAETPQWKYTLTHEWGHHIDNGSGWSGQATATTQAIDRLKKEFPFEFRSGYSGENTKEFYAEMFAEYFLTKGTTPNLLVQGMAKEFGWKVPSAKAVTPKPIPAKKPAQGPAGSPEMDIPAPSKPVYVPAKKPAEYYTVKKAEELQEGVPWKPDGENLYLKKVLDEQGFNGKPRVVSAAEYQKAVDSGATPLYRGVAGDTPTQVDEFVSQLLTGDTPYVGRGMFGDGTYFTDVSTTALKFAKEDRLGNPINFGKTIDAALAPEARIIDLEDLQVQFMRTTKMTPAQKELYYSYPQDFYEDASMWATTRGYDAIRIKNPVVNWETQEALPDVYTIVLNRTALIVKEMP
jgi:hypothetical protein